MKALDAVAVLGALASDQFGLVTTAQARDHAVSAGMLAALCEGRVLHRVGRGVYRVAGAPQPAHLDITAAWLRLDPARAAWRRDGRGHNDAVVSHRSACVLLELGDIPHPRIELTVPRPRALRDPDVRLHVNAGPLERIEVTTAAGLPTTTAARTITDLLREGVDGGHVGGVVADAARRGLVDVCALAEPAGAFAARYGMAGASGLELLAALAVQAGAPLPAH